MSEAFPVKTIIEEHIFSSILRYQTKESAESLWFLTRCRKSSSGWKNKASGAQGISAKTFQISEEKHIIALPVLILRIWNAEKKYIYMYWKIWDSLQIAKFSFREFCQPKKAHLGCYLIHWWEGCVRQQHKVNCWYWHGGSWTLVEDLCLCLLVKLSVEDNSKERGKETWSIKYIFWIIRTYNWATTTTG